jgi:hypothetical protein
MGKLALMGKLLKLAPWLIAVGFAWSFGFVYNVYAGGELSWLKAMYQKKLVLAAQIQAPRRLLIAGGSGVHHSLNSEVLEQELGIPVMNMGLDGPVGLNVILPSVLKAVRPGDIVLLIPEDLILLDEDGILERSAPFAIAIGHPDFGNIPPKQLTEAFWMLGVPSLRPLVKSGVDLLEKGRLDGYYADPINQRGDPTVAKTRHGKWWLWQISQSISPHAIARITQFKRELAAKDAQLVLSLPWVYGSHDQENLENMQKITEELSKIAPLVYDDHEFYNLKTDSTIFADTHHHLLVEARKDRSRKLARVLKPVLKDMQN